MYANFVQWKQDRKDASDKRAEVEPQRAHKRYIEILILYFSLAGLTVLFAFCLGSSICSNDPEHRQWARATLITIGTGVLSFALGSRQKE